MPEEPARLLPLLVALELGDQTLTWRLRGRSPLDSRLEEAVP